MFVLLHERNGHCNGRKRKLKNVFLVAKTMASMPSTSGVVYSVHLVVVKSVQLDLFVLACLA